MRNRTKNEEHLLWRAISLRTLRQPILTTSRAWGLAAKRGLRDQTYLEMLLHEALDAEEKKLASWLQALLSASFAQKDRPRLPDQLTIWKPILQGWNRHQPHCTIPFMRIAAIDTYIAGNP
jgi:hypothetical protein